MSPTETSLTEKEKWKLSSKLPAKRKEIDLQNQAYDEQVQIQRLNGIPDTNSSRLHSRR